MNGVYLSHLGVNAIELKFKVLSKSMRITNLSNKLRQNKLTCGWCGSSQDPHVVKLSFRLSNRIHYPCDSCTRRLQIYRSVDGYYSAMMADKSRYFRNLALKKNRI
jgi:hypothetical protein